VLIKINPGNGSNAPIFGIQDSLAAVPMAGAFFTGYDAPSRAGKGDEKALHSRRQTGQSATPQDIEAKGSRGIQSCDPSRFGSC
jgi:hypothetical protein